MKKLSFKVTGMSCTMCSSHVEKSVRRLNGVSEVLVNLVDGNMEVSVEDENVTSEKIIAAVTDAGYGAELITNETELGNEQSLKNKEMTKRLIISLLITIPLFLAALLYHPEKLGTWELFGIAQMALAIIVMKVGKKFYINGLKSFLKLRPTMDTLVAIGTGASFIYSLFILLKVIFTREFNNEGLYFDSSAMILTIVTLGKFIENRSKRKVSAALQDLMNLAPKEATRVKTDGTQEIVSFDSIKVGDIILVKPGEHLGIDGVIIEGNSTFDESAITGESLSVDHGPGDTLYSGSLNQFGVIKVKALTTGSDTTISKIVELMKKASLTKAKLTRTIDKISLFFVPTILLLAILTGVIWYKVNADLGQALIYAISVLVISCPCALGLATPLSIMVGMGVGAKSGILFKTSEALESLYKIKNLVMDKTGTLTTGEAKVNEICSNVCDQGKFLEIAASLELSSEHPLAAAIIKEAKSQHLEIQVAKNFSYEPGLGISGNVDDQNYYFGNYRFITQKCNQKNIPEITTKAETILYLASEAAFIGYLSISDEIRYSSINLLEDLDNLKVNAYMITGDNQESAYKVADHLKISHDQVKAQCLPQDKEQFVTDLKNKNLTAMVGDGINDGPALMKADIGIAIGAGSGIALESSSVILIKNEPTDIVKAIDLSKSTVKNIYENIFWCFIYNLVCIPIAGGALATFGIGLTPVMAAIAMSASSLCVVINALRLSRWKYKKAKDIDRNIEEIKEEDTTPVITLESEK